MKKVWIALIAVLIMMLVTVQFVLPPSSWAVDRAEAEETARLLAKLLRSGRLVIEQNQLLIDDQRKGDKGFTPDVFEKQLVEEFRQQTGIDLTKIQNTPLSIAFPPLAKELLPNFVLASKEVAAAVNAAINDLSEELRQAITLREVEGLSYEEISDAMNCPIGTVRSRIFRAREAIAARLRPLLDTREGERW